MAENRNFPAPGVPESKKKLPHCLETFLCFSRPGPHGREIAKYRYFSAFWPRAALFTWRNPGAGPKTGKCNFPVLGALLGGGYGAPKSPTPKARNFFSFYVLPDRAPTGGKSRNTGVFRPFWPRTAPSVGGREPRQPHNLLSQNTQAPGARGGEPSATSTPHVVRPGHPPQPLPPQPRTGL